MRYEVQVHFENQGHLVWHEETEETDIVDVITKASLEQWGRVLDKETKRWLFFDMTKITAMIITPKPIEEEDIFRRTYATQTGKIESFDSQKHIDGDEI